MKILLAWLGNADIRGSEQEVADSADIGPIAQALSELTFEKLCLLTDDKTRIYVDAYIAWLKKRSNIMVESFHVELSDPTEYRGIYKGATSVIDSLIERFKDSLDLTFHISPGTPAMQTVWVLLANSQYEAKLIQTSRENERVKTPDIPFQIAAEFIPKVLSPADNKLKNFAGEIPPEGAEFGDIIYRSKEMARVILLAKKAAPRNLPVLIQGESGTGKELLAKAIKNESPRAGKPLIVVNCGAIPKDLVESTLFGHMKGAFTGAIKDQKGVFEEADGGTLFLDEIGELPLDAQVKLLRVIQEEKVIRVGSTREASVDVRIIAATNRKLAYEVAQGRFREDLFFRLAIAVIEIPPLKKRDSDIDLLLDYLLEKVNNDFADDPSSNRKILSVGARNVAKKHNWPGNVRELLNTIKRVVLWTDGEKITEKDMESAILPQITLTASEEQVLNKDLNQPIEINKIISQVARHYLDRAMEQTAGNKAQAARLLGLNNATTMSNWLKKF